MKSWMALAIGLSLGGCQSTGGGAQSCKLASAAYVGYIDLTRGYGPEEGLEGGASLDTAFGGSAVYIPSATAGAQSLPNSLGIAADTPSFFAGCASIAGSNECCYVVASAGDAGDSPGDNLSDWNVTVTNQSDPDAGGDVAAGRGCDPSFPLACDGGSLTEEIWSGGDQLLVQGNGTGTVGTFSGQVTAPHNVDGLNPDLFSPDGGTVPLGQDLTLTWTPGGAASVTINAEDGQTLGMVICTVPDNGSYTIPSAALSNFQSGDQGGLAVFRSAESCAYSDDASISILVQTETWGRVVFQ